MGPNFLREVENQHQQPANNGSNLWFGKFIKFCSLRICRNDGIDHSKDFENGKSVTEF